MGDSRRTQEPRPIGGPTLTARMRDMADRVDVADVADFVEGDAFATGQRLADVLDDMLTAAGHERRRQGLTA